MEANKKTIRITKLSVWMMDSLRWFLRQTVANKVFWSDVIVFLCGVLFLYSAGDKLWEYEKFRVQVGKSPILTGKEGFIVWFIPSIEILITLLMIPAWLRQIGLYAFFTLMLTFTGYITLLLQDGPIVPCGCNALTEKLSLEAHIALNLGFCAIAALAVFLTPAPDFTVPTNHPLYRRFLVPAASRISTIFSCFSRKEVNGNER